ncbi:MAG: hypothetical protein ACI376_05150 [Candidatus Bruticola sp.]
MLCKVVLPHGVQEVSNDTFVCDVLCRDLLGIDSTEQALKFVLCMKHLREVGCVGAQVDGEIVDLKSRITSNCTVTPLTQDDYFGRHIIMRSSAHLLVYAAKLVNSEAVLEIGQSLHSQLFFNVKNVSDIEAFGEEVNKKFTYLCAKNTPFKTSSVAPSAALNMIDDPDGDRRYVVNCWVGPSFGIVNIGNYTDLAYGPFVPDAGFLRSIKVVGMEEGLLLAQEPVQLPSKELKEFMLGAAMQAKEWNKRMNIDTVGKLNKMILNGEGQNLVQVSETLHELRIGQIVRDIISRPKVKVVFISGPSSSGKTSTVRRLSTHLQAMGRRTVYVGLDDYYLPCELCPRDEKGDYDFEAIEALNLKRIQSDLQSLVEGKSTKIPHYDFVSQRPGPAENEKAVCLADEQILLIEGIHGLNPAITDAVAKENRYALFVSALPQLNMDKANRVPTTYARLLRRIIRDRRYRGISAVSTIMRWPSVRRGENKYIFPYQSRSDAMFNSALAYELAVFRHYAWPYLLEVPEDSPAYTMARDMLRFLTKVVPMDSEWVPKNSVLREFLGGSIYQY